MLGTLCFLVRRLAIRAVYTLPLCVGFNKSRGTGVRVDLRFAVGSRSVSGGLGGSGGEGASCGSSGCAGVWSMVTGGVVMLRWGCEYGGEDTLELLWSSGDGD
jgi:hypothetical protein